MSSSPILPRPDHQASDNSGGGARERERSGADAPLLDKSCADARVIDSIGKTGVVGKARSVRWTRYQRATYDELLPWLEARLAGQWIVFFITLTSAQAGADRKLAAHRETLMKRIEVEYGSRPPECYRVRTTEGHGVSHELWAWPPAPTSPRRIEYTWLSAAWLEIHGAWVVNVKRVGGRGRDGLRLSRYIVSQYCAGQSGYVRSSHTRGIFGLKGRLRSLYIALRRELKDIAWPLPWQVTNRVVRDRLAVLLRAGFVDHQGRRLLLWQGAIEPL